MARVKVRRPSFAWNRRSDIANSFRFVSVGALIAMMRAFGWERITLLATDTQFSKDLANEIRKLWVGEHDGWNGEVKYSDTFRIDWDGNVAIESIDKVLDNVPTDNPSVNSRIIVLAAHSEHAFPILKRARERDFQPDTIWVGPSSWAGRDDYTDFSWLPDIPGYLGVAPFRNREDRTHAGEPQNESHSQSTGPALTLSFILSFYRVLE
jgi:hypothetical protein